METGDIIDWAYDNFRIIFFPEELIAIDKELSKIELASLFFVARLGEITMSRLAELMNVPMSTATGIVDRLVKNGYLARERSESDRRIVVIMETEKGKTVLSTVKRTVLRYIEPIREALTDKEHAALLRIAMKIFDVLRGIEKPKGSDSRAEHKESETLTRIEIE